MNFEDPLDDDPLAEILAAPRNSSSADPVREAVLMQAAGVLRRRRWMRRAGSVVTLAVCYVAGLATMGLVRHDDRPAIASTSQQEVPASDEASNVAAASPISQATEESEAFADQVTPTHASFGFYRAAGDYQLLRLGNMQAAVRLYSQALDLASPADLAISAGADSWLLMSLKQSRLQDARDVHEEG